MKTEFTYQIGDEIRTVAVEREGDCFQVTIGEATYQIRAQRPEHGRLNLQVGDRRLRAHVASDGLRRYVAMAGQTWTLERPQPQQKRRAVGHHQAAGHIAQVLDNVDAKLADHGIADIAHLLHLVRVGSRSEHRSSEGSPCPAPLLMRRR